MYLFSISLHHITVVHLTLHELRMLCNLFWSSQWKQKWYMCHFSEIKKWFVLSRFPFPSVLRARKFPRKGSTKILGPKMVMMRSRASANTLWTCNKGFSDDLELKKTLSTFAFIDLTRASYRAFWAHQGWDVQLFTLKSFSKLCGEGKWRMNVISVEGLVTNLDLLSIVVAK